MCVQTRNEQFPESTKSQQPLKYSKIKIQNERNKASCGKLLK